MNPIEILLIIFIILLIIYFLYSRKYKIIIKNNMTQIQSTIDGRTYTVRDLPDKQSAANYLATLRSNLIKVVNYLKTEYSKDERINRLYNNFNPDTISESEDEPDITSYSVNKGEKINFCVRQRDETNTLVDQNTMMFVAIHELSHLATKSIGHTEEFWENMKFIEESIISSPLKLYEYKPYHTDPQEYCGTTITSNPLK